MFEVREGNLIDALLNGEVKYIMHCCNTHANFGSGIAKEIADRIPSAYEVDKLNHDWWNVMCDNNYKQARIEQVGDFSHDPTSNVFNLYGQQNWGRGKQVNYGGFACALSEALDSIYEGDPDWDEVLVGLPYKIASDRAGGYWEVVKEIVEGMFEAKCMNMVWYKL